jgi:hypothetical protein
MNPAYGPGSSAGPPSSSTHPNQAPYEYGSAIDPALAGAEAGSAAAPPPTYAARRGSTHAGSHAPPPVKMERKPGMRHSPTYKVVHNLGEGLSYCQQARACTGSSVTSSQPTRTTFIHLGRFLTDIV